MLASTILHPWSAEADIVLKSNNNKNNTPNLLKHLIKYIYLKNCCIHCIECYLYMPHMHMSTHHILWSMAHELSHQGPSAVKKNRELQHTMETFHNNWYLPVHEAIDKFELWYRDRFNLNRWKLCLIGWVRTNWEPRLTWIDGRAGLFVYLIIHFGWPLEIHFNLLTKNEFCHGIPAQNPSARCKICRTKY